MKSQQKHFLLYGIMNTKSEPLNLAYLCNSSKFKHTAVISKEQNV
jgi:hypothetical protein